MTAPRHGGDRVADVLAAAGVPCVYTLCGGHISPILSAAKARGIRIVDTRDEATAVFAADAAARLSGRPGVAAVTAGPGISNTITALKNAQLAQSPLLLLGGAAPTALLTRAGCSACHVADKKLIGPSWREIHGKHGSRADAEAYLAGKIKSGGVGVWGAIPMPAQGVSEEDAKVIARWLAAGASR